MSQWIPQSHSKAVLHIYGMLMAQINNIINIEVMGSGMTKKYQKLRSNQTAIVYNIQVYIYDYPIMQAHLIL